MVQHFVARFNFQHMATSALLWQYQMVETYTHPRGFPVWNWSGDHWKFYEELLKVWESCFVGAASLKYQTMNVNSQRVLVAFVFLCMWEFGYDAFDWEHVVTLKGNHCETTYSKTINFTSQWNISTFDGINNAGGWLRSFKRSHWWESLQCRCPLP